ncbi:MAG TPA: hypothetical protein VFW24_15775 [Acidimicrobiales bacterium]|nr:hypothetical protein [Acidimicrobiales bacterium]
MGMAAVVAVALAGGGSSQSPLQRVQSAPDVTEATGSARVSITTEVQGHGPGTRPPPPTTAIGTFSFASAGGSMQLALPPGALVSGPVALVVDHSRFFIRLPAATASPLGSRPWLAVEPIDQPELSTTSLGPVGLVQSLSPALMLAELRGVTGAPKVIGTPGAPAGISDYRVAVNLARAEGLASGPERQSLHQLRSELGLVVIHGEVRLDSAGRVVLWTLGFELSHVLPNLALGTEVVTVRFSDFGTDESFSVPPSTQVTEFASVQGSPALAPSGGGG